MTDQQKEPALRELTATTAPAPERPTTILQFGGGNFLRAFVDLMVHDANRAGVMNAGIAVVFTTPNANGTFELLRRQDGRYHVLLEGVRDGEPVREVTLVESVTTAVHAHREFDAYRALYLSPELTTIVSNTTEAGIVWVEGDDLTAQPPASFPAKVTALLHDRWEHFGGAPDKGLRIVCCELIEDNATTLREYVLRHAAAAGLPAAFVAWVETACSFHDTLVDRIVPGFPRDEIDAVQAELGYRDDLVVKGEHFGVWAIATGEPGGPGEAIRDVLPLDRAGQPVEFLADIRPFRAKKVRILNGLHTAMAAVGLLAGRNEVSDAVANLTIASYLGHLLHGEVLPSIPEYSASDDGAEALAEFADRITERFTNPSLHHRLADISLNSISKWQARNLPVALDAWGAGREAPLTVLAFAALAVLYSGRGFDAARVAESGFEVRDDAALVALVRDTFPAEGTDDDVERWLRGVIDAAGFFSADDAADGYAPAARLAAEAAPLARTILEEGITVTLKTNA
ncbi:Mannitol dehydrogenase domain protein [Xylanimonas cellulosilytica DSM 15894]|uniref:Mannitol dehydrogenase domain protein n=1 Tax=Xylanimonas cellulosilytica (strain DSM 15894 / JCM 12276 / CECT 5975 / KCTC 9989 / LMG 20990 / NBRC 107835 / XIL07) TaxID=446471 RepID=D1BXA2_XYLCX|nr:tagaturonate reductase [Xylanimonas cellulosilytica]ACZ31670.1 Mannitol dehydrogenase domain protein [Xylanimonas cellulosilytica DSM 15894]